MSCLIFFCVYTGALHISLIRQVRCENFGPICMSAEAHRPSREGSRVPFWKGRQTTFDIGLKAAGTVL